MQPQEKGYESSIKHRKWLQNAVLVLEALHWMFFLFQTIRVGFYLKTVGFRWSGWHSDALSAALGIKLHVNETSKIFWVLVLRLNQKSFTVREVQLVSMCKENWQNINVRL